MNQNKIKFDFNDILIEPAPLTDISTRSMVGVCYGDGYLPLFTAPMDTVVSEDNIDFFIRNGIKVIRPRTVKCPPEQKHLNSGPSDFASYGINEFEDVFINGGVLHSLTPIYALIDIANGHMTKLLWITKKAKEMYGESMILMVGNVASPVTYKIFSEAGADMIRIGIGNGGGCLTTVQTGVGYPMASLIYECYQIGQTIDSPAKIIADGGFKNYSDVIKALALGADYVMLGSMLNKALESAGDTYEANKKFDSWTEPGDKVNQYSKETADRFESGCKFYKKFRGMSTKEAQIAMGKTELKTSEGVTRIQPVEYTLDGWRRNFISYLSSAMSYSNATTLSEFIGKAEWNMISINSFNRFNK